MLQEQRFACGARYVINIQFKKKYGLEEVLWVRDFGTQTLVCQQVY